MYCEDLVVIYQGNILKYGWLIENKKNKRKKQESQ